MLTRPAVVITRADCDRLQTLLEDPAGFAGPEGQTLRDLEEELDRAEIVNAEEVPPDVVTMGSTVRVRDLETGAERVYRIVFPFERRRSQEDISVLAPVGAALLGYRRGDIVEWRVPKGLRRLKVLEVLYQPEAARSTGR